jgi:hypothetical protein
MGLGQIGGRHSMKIGGTKFKKGDLSWLKFERSTDRKGLNRPSNRKSYLTKRYKKGNKLVN